jgi:adenylate cyclase
VTNNWQRWGRIACAGLAFGLVVLLQLLQPVSVVRFDEGLRDTFVRLHASDTPEDRLVIVDIDAHAIQEVGNWPWPRGKVADLIEALMIDYEARKIALDIVFPKRGDTTGDQRLALLLEHLPVTKAQVLDYTPDRTDTLAEGALSSGQPSQVGGLSGAASYLRAYGYIGNHAAFSGASCAGNVGFVPDPDGVLRRLPTLTIFDDRGYLGLSDALLRCATPSSAGDVSVVAPAFYARGTWRVPYHRAQAAYTVVSAADVIAGRLPAELIKGRYVLVGSSSLSLGDRTSTPLAPLTAGLMVHAAALSALLDIGEGTLALPRDATPYVLVFCGLFFALAVHVVARFGALTSTAYLLGISCVWVLFGYQLAVRQYEFSLVAPLVGVLTLLMTLVPLEWWLTQAQSRNLRNTLGRYVAKPVIDALTRSGNFTVLVPQTRQVTVLVADMAGYTRQTSSVPLQEIVELTKEFLDCITRPVLEHGGTLDKYTGDGLLAFWGAPLPCENSADLAIDAALHILKDFEALNQRREARGLSPLRMRIGIESGEAVVGELGTRFRTTYTAIGECVNHASRLETAASTFERSLLIGPATASLTREHALTRVGSLTIRGTDAQIDVYSCEPAQGTPT